MLLCAGCALLALSTQQSFTVNDEFVLKNPTQEVMPIVEQVGKSLGYRLKGRQKYGDASALMFEVNTSMLLTMVSGYHRMANVMVMYFPTQKKLQLQMMVLGNLGTGTEKDLQKALQEFKTKLQESFRAQGISVESTSNEERVNENILRGDDRITDKNRLSQLVSGKTTKDDIKKLFGDPLNEKVITTQSEGKTIDQEMWSYVFIKKGSSDTAALTLFFSKDGMLTSWQQMK
jgi:hypothetical protein